LPDVLISLPSMDGMDAPKEGRRGPMIPNPG